MIRLAWRIARFFVPPADCPHAHDSDIKMMARCIALSRDAVEAGEFPFACVIADGDTVVVETTNRVARERDVTRHAELLAISEAQRKVDKRKLRSCTLYSTVEPCPMCSFMIREANIARVVFAIRSPLMGGHSRWNVLGDPVLADSMPEMFGTAPSITVGLLQREAESVWWRMNPLAWGVIRMRGVFGGQPSTPPADAPLPDSVVPDGDSKSISGRSKRHRSRSRR